MNKKSSLKSPKLDESPHFLDIESSVFTQVGKDIYIGRNQIDPTLRSVLRDEAINLQNSRLWEILHASVLNEAYHHALDNSADFDAVRFAKALKHWDFFILNVINILSKKE